MTTKTNIIARLLFIVYIALVAWLCFGHFSNLPQISRTIFGIPTDKVVHFCMFFPFPILLYLSFSQMTKKPWHTILFVTAVFLLGSLIAAGTEIGQSFTTYRSCDPKDFRADMIALGISAFIVMIIDLSKQFRTR